MLRDEDEGNEGDDKKTYKIEESVDEILLLPNR